MQHDPTGKVSYMLCCNTAQIPHVYELSILIDYTTHNSRETLFSAGAPTYIPLRFAYEDIGLNQIKPIFTRDTWNFPQLGLMFETGAAVREKKGLRGKELKLD